MMNSIKKGEEWKMFQIKSVLGKNKKIKEGITRM